jgi:phosphatidate cytidylyltransferase
MLGTRVVSGSILIALVLGGLCLDEWAAPWYPIWFVLSTLVLGAAAIELVGLLRATSSGPSLNSVLGGVMALVVSNWMPHVSDHLERSGGRSAGVYEPNEPISILSWPLLTFVGVLMISFVVQSIQFQKPGRTMSTIAGTVLAVAYVGLLGSFTIQMRWFEGTLHGIVPLVLLIATAKGADTGAYILGRIAGRHKLWPQLSPNKTVEGAIGGLILATAAALAVTALARYLLGITLWPWRIALAYGIVIGTVAQLGDLMESMIKRDCDRKDASSAVPGFGGVLDVIDSLLFAGPVAYGFWLGFGP